MEDGGTIPLLADRGARPARPDPLGLQALHAREREGRWSASSAQAVDERRGRGLGAGARRSCARRSRSVAWLPRRSRGAADGRPGRRRSDGDADGRARDRLARGSAAGARDRARTATARALASQRARSSRRRCPSSTACWPRPVRRSPSSAAAHAARRARSCARCGPGLRAAPATLRLALPFLAEAGPRSCRGRAALPARRPTRRSPRWRRLQPRPRATCSTWSRPVTECLRRNAIPTLKTADRRPAALAPATRSTRSCSTRSPGQASASQNFDGNGTAIRYHAGFGEQTRDARPAAGTTEPLVGLRVGADPRARGPQLPSRQPPFRPDVPCSTSSRPTCAPRPGRRRSRAPRGACGPRPSGHGEGAHAAGARRAQRAQGGRR